MHRDPKLVVITPPVPSAPRLPSVADVPSDQLWREAIHAARQAAHAAEELRRAIQASRASDRRADAPPS